MLQSLASSGSGVTVSSQDRAANATLVDLTTELRWFFDGPMPAEVRAWFTRSGATGLVENRCDAYRIESSPSVGVKRRDGETLELKLRLQPPELAVPPHGLDGWIETWQRWSPADGLVDLQGQSTWVEVNKTIIKRRIDFTGDEVALSADTLSHPHQSCDVEVVTLSVGGRLAWSFALAAFGPVDRHLGGLTAAWQVLVAEQPKPEQLRLGRENSIGYPQWLQQVTTQVPDTYEP